MERKRKLELALRANEGRRRLPRLRVALEEALGNSLGPDPFLPLDHTDRLQEVFSAELARSRSLYLPVYAYPKLVAVLASFAGRCTHTEAYLLHPLDRYTGAVRVPVGVLLGRVERVWNGVSENFGLASEDALNGLYLDANLTGHSGDGYDVAAWGHSETLLTELESWSG